MAPVTVMDILHHSCHLHDSCTMGVGVTNFHTAHSRSHHMYINMIMICPALHHHRWIGGVSDDFAYFDVSGEYQVPNTASHPSVRTLPMVWGDNNDRVWLFGGKNSSTTTTTFRNDCM